MPNTGTMNVQFTKTSLPTLDEASLAPAYSFAFSPSTLVLDAGFTDYKVTFVLTSNVRGVAITGERFIGNQPNNLVTIPYGAVLALTFDTPPGVTYNFEVTVTLPDGQKFTSSDPEIEIPPG